jgi:hypothetical protein
LIRAPSGLANNQPRDKQANQDLGINIAAAFFVHTSQDPQQLNGQPNVASRRLPPLDMRESSRFPPFQELDIGKLTMNGAG